MQLLVDAIEEQAAWTLWNTFVKYIGRLTSIIAKFRVLACSELRSRAVRGRFSPIEIGTVIDGLLTVD